MRRYKASFLILLIGNSIGYSVFGQINCTPANSSFVFTPTPLSQNKFIAWDKFPEFSLPFKIIYNGPRFGDQNQQPLKHGFSHLSSYSGPDSANLPVKNRALIYYGVAYNFPKPQPWQLIRSPWSNDINGYRAKWRGEMSAYSYHFDDTKGTRSPAADLLIIDVERHWEGQFQLATDLSILGIKNDPLVPKVYSQLTDNQFVERYKRDMLTLYSEPLEFMKNDGLLSKFNSISSYGDVPIRYQGLNIEGNQWVDWQTNPARLSYLMKDTLTNSLGGSFYNQLDFMSPSIYIQADYAANPKARGGNYLAEMLFQIEANKSRTQKDIIPFAWLRYEDFSLPYPRFVKPFQAEAMAIFPFFSGAKGLVLWEDSFVNLETVNFTTYEYFINGLYRLSLYKSFFEGNHELVQSQNPRDLFLNQLPVWRGVVKDDKILIAAHNPYAGDNETTSLQVAYKNWFTTIQLKGKEVFLCSFDLVNITSNEPSIDPFELKILDNPIVNNTLNISFQLPDKQLVEIKLFDLFGRNFHSEKLNSQAGQNNYTKQFPNWPKGIFILEIKTKNAIIRKKIIN